MTVSNPHPTSHIQHPGILYGIGVGPGDPELLTIKAVNVLRKVGVIAIPKSGEEAGSKALSVMEKVVDLNGKEILELVLPMTKDKDVLLKARKDAVLLLAERLKNGSDVACITIGDPLFYSTFSYLIPFIMDILPGVEIKIISGISSINAAAGSALMPLVEADERIAIIPAAYGERDLKKVIEGFDTVVLMKVNKVFDRILSVLNELGLKEKAVFISKAGWPDEEVVRDMDSLKGKKFDYFSMVIVKK